jgi:hypothetical protein
MGSLNMKSRNASTSDDDQHRLAVLIDADNAQAGVIGGLLAETAKFGTASVRRIYGDFTSNRLAGWKSVLLEHSIQPVQQFAYTRGKNATDSALIIDAMDLMYTGRFDGFCLVSSDSDFTRLAQRLREEGLTVYGFGERKTPDPFVQACDKFIYTDLLRSESAEPTEGKVNAKVTEKNSESDSSTKRPGDAVQLVRQAIEEASDDAGWAHLGEVGSYLTKLRPDFDPRLYGQRKLSDLVKALPKHFQVEERGTAGSSAKQVYVRSKAK